MYPPCIKINEKLIPEVRKRVSKMLVEKGYSQTQISGILHVTQPMVNKYLKEEIDKDYLFSELNVFSENMVDRIVNNYSESEIVDYFCDFCMSLRESGRFCNIHYISTCDHCFKFRNVAVLGEKKENIEVLKKAIRLLSSMDVSSITPEVRMNLAYATKDASTKSDVAAIPGRITVINGKIRSWEEPEYGSSKHLSELLLSRVKQTAYRAVINIKFDPEIMKKLKKLRYKVEIVDRSKVKDLSKISVENEYQVLVDPGTFGIEPATYIFGKDPIDVAKKVITIMELRS
jgi:predicted fused transcriptional regulator/phosphomethylpyrimidine kinase/predicted transcriptional regulator